MKAKNFKYVNNWKSEVPEPVFEKYPEMVDFYWKAWELAYDHIKEKPGMPQTPYMDEGFKDTDIWIWDTCFMAMFCKYCPSVFPGIESLKNFYMPIHENVQTPLRIHILDNPPLFAWTEYLYYKMTGDKEHLKDLMLNGRYLQRHFDWFANPPEFVMKEAHEPNTVCLKSVDGGFLWEGGRSGMDNTPRGRTGERALEDRPNNPRMLWIDAIAQQGLSALYISRLAREIDCKEEAEKYLLEYEKIKKQVNDLYWNEEDGFYYDVDVETKEHMKVRTIASFWPMMAEMSSPEQAVKMAALLEDPDAFGGFIPWPSLVRNDMDFEEDGRYWRGGVWLPTAYMGIKALEKYGYNELADQTALKIVEHMLETYKTYSPNTIWEAYSPTRPLPAKFYTIVRPNFCGWSALGPIALFIENILGFHTVDAPEKRIEWRLRRNLKHGIRNLRFGDIETSIVYDGENSVSVESNAQYSLAINGLNNNIQPGKQSMKIS